ncbi:tyrosine decarboxylase [Vagococcus vulneris]|uniref:Tyrosine decarboxylase n=1 Tax=Vagococcus vulneris TaxID=1977869 RepID=A0A429ZWI8_9ENTE|nr:tyrosine decarboxylase [Vagococcus vulneris]RST98154.1 tyrosine decarboxylase [Vagococcus vulneris]
MSNKNIIDPTDTNLKALFLGDKGENVDIYKDILNRLIDEHVGWRQNYMPQDLPVITPQDRRSESFQATVDNMNSVFNVLSSKMRTDSMPWHSAGRFWGHMNSETLLPAIIAYNFAMLWNGNNVAYESSPATSKMEEEVGHDFATLMSYENGWGHIACDGSIANLEGIWYARNFKSAPLAIKKVVPEALADKTEWELLNMSVEDTLDLLDKYQDKYDEIKEKTARSGENIKKLGKWIVPQTKHYSWLKSADIIGVGLDQVIACDVTNEYRMDVEKLEEVIRDLAAQGIPTLGVVAVVGSTEEGQIDRVDEIVALREKLAKEGIYFYIHVDAAYGGYARSIFLDENDKFIDYANIEEVYAKNNIFYDKNTWLTEEVYNSFRAISDCESVTIDPHKMGYIPYSAGGVVIKDVRMRDMISYFATYVFKKGADIPALLGAYILEGSKAGATAAAVWTAHRVLPLNVTGFGKLIGASIEGAFHFYELINGLEFKVGDKTVVMHALTHPDFNMVDYVFNEKGNTDLKVMNDLNDEFYSYASYEKGGTYENEFITSHTDFAVPEYGNSPLDFVKGLGFSDAEWEKEQKVTILRASAMSPYMNDKKVFDIYAEKIKQAIQDKLDAIYDVK